MVATSPVLVVNGSGVISREGCRLSRCVLRPNPDQPVVPVSLRVSMVVEGMIVIRGDRGLWPSRTSERFLF
jgi:hypothetical protein